MMRMFKEQQVQMHFKLLPSTSCSGLLRYPYFFLLLFALAALKYWIHLQRLLIEREKQTRQAITIKLPYVRFGFQVKV